MGLTNTHGFRGSAAFFALLLAGASGAAASPPGADRTPPDHAAAIAAPAVRPAASKFSRRKLPFIRPGRARSMLA
jgi:hypothetical protein